MTIALSPGADVSTYSFSIGEPHLFNTDISANFTTFYRNRLLLELQGRTSERGPLDWADDWAMSGRSE